MNKQKKTPYSFHRKLMRWPIILSGAFGLGVCGYIAFMTAYVSIGSIPTSPDPALLPTAEYLYAHPQPAPAFIRVKSHASPSFPSLCYEAGYIREGRVVMQLAVSQWTELFLNGVRIPPTSVYAVSTGDFSRDEMSVSWNEFCMDSAQLEPGLYLLELHLRRTLWETPIIYQWAVKVGE